MIGQPDGHVDDYAEQAPNRSTLNRAACELHFPQWTGNGHQACIPALKEAHFHHLGVLSAAQPPTQRAEVASQSRNE